MEEGSCPENNVGTRFRPAISCVSLVADWPRSLGNDVLSLVSTHVMGIDVNPGITVTVADVWL